MCNIYIYIYIYIYTHIHTYTHIMYNIIYAGVPASRGLGRLLPPLGGRLALLGLRLRSVFIISNREISN